MLYSREKALSLWYRYNLKVPVDLRSLTGQLGLEVVVFPFTGRVNEVILGNTIGVRTHLQRPWFRWYVAHAIGHHVMHSGSSLDFAAWQWAERAKAERQAEEFAAWLTGGPNGWLLTASVLGIPPEKYLLVRRLTQPESPVRGN